MKVIGHRGAAKIAPENSLKGLRVARNLRLSGVELDISVTKDNKLVVFHDETLTRLAGINKKVRSLTLDELKQIKLKGGETIPSLQEFFKNSRSMPLFIEGKGSGWAELLSKALRSFEKKDLVTVLSFNKKELAKFHELNPKTKTYWVTLSSKGAINVAKKNGFSGLCLLYLNLFNPNLRKDLRASGLDINAFTVDRVFVAKLLSKLYPGIYITTNVPHLIKKQTKPIGK
jgi:glycerophosphoryl diester phosphodiesterase